MVAVAPVLDRVPNFAALLEEGGDAGFAAIRRAEGSGRPVGAAQFIAGLERILGRPIARRAPGAKTSGRRGGQMDLGQ